MKKIFYTLISFLLLFMGQEISAQLDPSVTISEEKDEWAVKFFRVSNPNEFLYEDANSIYSKDKGLNFLGVEGKGDEKNSAMLVRYMRGKVMPQYLIILGKSVVEGYEYLCPECHSLDCPHSKVEMGYTTGRFLISLKDSVNHYGNNSEKHDLFTWNDIYSRLAFVEGKLYEDSLLIIQNSALENKKNVIDVKSAGANGEGAYCPALFSFRLLRDEDDGDFLIESWAENIASMEGEWVKIQNGVPVIVESTIQSAISYQAEVFNLVYTNDKPVSNPTIETEKIEVIGGIKSVTISGASDKRISIVNALGQLLVNRTSYSDEAVFSVPSGIVFVTVEGTPTQKVVVRN